VVRRALIPAALLLLTVAGAACVDDNIPPRPKIDASVPDGGDDVPSADDGGSGCGDDAGTDGGAVLLAKTSSCDGLKLVVSGCTLYWTEEDTGLVKSVPTGGGPVTTIASGQLFPRALAVDGTSIFWVVGDSGEHSKTHDTIMKRALAGGPSSVFIPPEHNPDPLGGENAVNAMLAANGWLYFARYIYTYKTPSDGDVPTPIGASPPNDLGQPGAFALGGAYLYQVELMHNGVSRERIDGNQVGLLEDGTSTAMLAPDRIAVSQLPNLVTDAIAVVDDHVAWAMNTSIWRKAGNTLWRDPKTLVADSLGGNMITGFVATDAVIFFGEYSADTVQTVGFYGGTPKIVATGQAAPSQFAADANNVYWRTSDCNIMKLAKPPPP